MTAEARTRSRTSVRSRVSGAAIGLGFFAFLVLLFAETEPLDRPWTPESALVWGSFPALLHGARLGYDRRRSGVPTMLAWGVGGIVATAVAFIGLILLAHAIGPSARTLVWLPNVLITIAVVAVLAGLTQHVRREATPDGRRIAITEVLALAIIPLGLWLTTMGEIRSLVGIALALAGPVLLYRLESERRRCGLTTDAAHG